MIELRTLAQRHWFYLLLPLLLAAAFGFRATHPWAEQPRFGEAVTLFDWCLFVPMLFALCYRDLPRRALALRMLAIACGGFWIAGRIVPAGAQGLLQDWGGIRWLGLAVLLLFEAVAIAAVLRIAFGASPDPEALERQGIPPLMAKLMLAEARFWRRLWARLTGR